MPFRYQRRINFGGGWGFNLSLRGISTSYRAKWGSVGPRGFSLRTGIPGLSFHQSWKGFGIFEFIIFFGLYILGLVWSIFWLLVEIVFLYLLPIAIQLILWCIYFIVDRLKSEKIENVDQGLYASNTALIKSQPDIKVECDKSYILPIVTLEMDFMEIEKVGEKIKVVITELNSNLRFRKYLKGCNLTNYGHLLPEESIIEHIVYADIYRLFSLLYNSSLVQQAFCQIEDSIRGAYKNRGETSFYVNSKLNNVILNKVVGLNAIIFKMYDDDNGLNLYNEIESALYSIQFCLTGVKYEEWRIQVRNLVSDPYQDLHSKVYNGFG